MTRKRKMKRMWMVMVHHDHYRSQTQSIHHPPHFHLHRVALEGPFVVCLVWDPFPFRHPLEFVFVWG